MLSTRSLIAGLQSEELLLHYVHVVLFVPFLRGSRYDGIQVLVDYTAISDYVLEPSSASLVGCLLEERKGASIENDL